MNLHLIGAIPLRMMLIRPVFVFGESTVHQHRGD